MISTSNSEQDRPLASPATKRRPAGAVIKKEELKSWQEAESYLEAARIELETARTQAAEFLQAERARGYSEGLEKGFSECLDLIAKTKTAADAFKVKLSETLVEAILQMIKSVFAELEPAEVVTSVVRRTLDTLDLGTEITLEVSPASMASVRATLEEKLSGASVSKIFLREVSELAPNGCRIVSQFGSVDLYIENQLHLLRSALVKAELGLHL